MWPMPGHPPVYLAPVSSPEPAERWLRPGTTRGATTLQLEEDLAETVVVGRPVIANPGLARRWQEDHPLNEIDQATVYTDGAAGYRDNPDSPVLGSGFLGN